MQARLLRGLAFAAAHIRVMQRNRRFNDIPNITTERTLELDPDMPPYAMRIIANFTPWSISAGQWHQVRHFVAETTVQMRPHTPDAARRVMNITAGFVAWAWKLKNCSLTVDDVFTAKLVARYMRTDERMTRASAGRRFDVSRQLAKVAQTLGNDLTVARTAAPKPGNTGRVFSDREIAAMHSWAISGSTAHKRRNACAILALAAGVGFTAAEVAAARVEHVRMDGDLMLVDAVGRRARTVPILASWRGTLERAIDGRRGGLLFTGYRLDEYPPRAIQSFLTDNPATVRPGIRDLRRGWIVTQINAGIPLTIVARVGGFNSLGALEIYLGYTDQATDPAEHFQAIANAGTIR